MRFMLSGLNFFDKHFLLAITLIASLSSQSQELARFSVRVEEERTDSPVSVSLDGINFNIDRGYPALYEINGEEELFTASQIETGHSARLWFIPDGDTEKGFVREFVLKLQDNEEQPDSMTIKVVRRHEDLIINSGGRPVLSYRIETLFPPEGVTELYKRSGFIHPLWSPGGQILTRVQPPDHYHHYGIWGPWTVTHIGEREVDFWNLAKGLGTVKFAGMLSLVEGEVYSGFKVLQQHIDFGAQGPDQVAMNEILDVRVWSVSEKVWVIDYTTTLNSPLPGGIMLDAYRYGGGIGFRATGKWHKDNCTVLTSDGKTRAEADGSFARWCIVEGESETREGRSGILFLSHPSNRMHPEPMRVWPPDSNGGRGDMYFEFVPIRHEDWKLEPLKDYTLKYRMVVFDGEMNAEMAGKYWNGFAENPVVKLNYR